MRREEQTGVANMHDWRTAEQPPSWRDQQDGALLIQVLRPAQQMTGRAPRPKKKCYSSSWGHQPASGSEDNYCRSS
jgi:hypothetical protein